MGQPGILRLPNGFSWAENKHFYIPHTFLYSICVETSNFHDNSQSLLSSAIVQLGNFWSFPRKV